jgi:hypothetical protein
MHRGILTIIAILIIIIGGILLVKIAIPNYLWVIVYRCNQTSMTVILRNDFPAPIEVKSITVFLYDRNGDLIGIKRINISDERLLTGFTLHRTINLKGLPVGEVASIVVRVDYVFLLVRGSVSATHTPICPR